jgi:hypothetical protein
MPSFNLPHLPHSDSFTNLAHQVASAFRHHKHEKHSEAHQVSPIITSSPSYSDPPQIFRQAAGHQPKGVFPQTINPVSVLKMIKDLY